MVSFPICEPQKVFGIGNENSLYDGPKSHVDPHGDCTYATEQFLQATAIQNGNPQVATELFNVACWGSGSPSQRQPNVNLRWN